MKNEDQAAMLLLGVGGGGCRLAASVRAVYGAGLHAVGVDTDALANRNAAAGGMTCLLLGGSRLSGHGTGGDAIQGRLAAQDDMQNLQAQMNGVRTAVVMACLGGGTGGGSTPEIVKALGEMGIATVCFVTMPFGFEGQARRKEAERVLPMIEESADSLVVVPLDDLLKDAGEDLMLENAVNIAEGIIAAGITLLWRLLSKPGFISLDAEKLHTMVMRGGNALFGCGSAAGDDRAIKSVAALRGCSLLRSGEALKRANALMLGILAGSDLRLAEVGEVMCEVNKSCKPGCHVEMGTVFDPAYEGRIELVALAFESWTAAVMAVPKSETEVAAEPPVADVIPARVGGRKVRSKGGSKLSFGATGRGKFKGVEPTLYNNQDLDVPTFIRRGIRLER
ncbi:MAG: hypothetical protein PHU80_10550 [Kiritimatiellae bacterium]|nr:hypothetical protein [Kiritimatiellia bacterium]